MNFFHRHKWLEEYGGRDARGCISEIWYVCGCGKFLSEGSRSASIRAAATENLYRDMTKDETP